MRYLNCLKYITHILHQHYLLWLILLVGKKDTKLIIFLPTNIKYRSFWIHFGESSFFHFVPHKDFLLMSSSRVFFLCHCCIWLAHYISTSRLNLDFCKATVTMPTVKNAVEIPEFNTRSPDLHYKCQLKNKPNTKKVQVKTLDSL